MPLSLVNFTWGTPWPAWSTTRIWNGLAQALLFGDAVNGRKNSSTASAATVRTILVFM